MSEKTRQMVSISLLSLSLSAPAALVPVLANLGEAYPEWGSWIQLLVTIPSLFMMLSSLFTDWMTRRFSLRMLAGGSVLLILLSGVFPYFISGFPFLLATRVMMGIGIGWLNTTASSLPAVYFTAGATRDFATGLQAAFISAGGIVFSLLSGQLAEKHWELVFLAQLINLLPLLAAAVIMPKGKPSVPTDETKSNRFFIKEALPISLLGFVIITLTITYPLNISVFASKGGLGGSGFVSILASVNSLIGFVVGLAFGKILNKGKQFTLPFGLLLTGAAFVGITFSPTAWVLLVASTLLGIGTSLISPALYAQLYASVPEQKVIGAVAMLGIGSNISQFVSPFLINPLARVLDGEGRESTRFLIVAGLLSALALGMIGTALKQRKQVKNE